MLNREKGWNFKNNQDIWSSTNDAFGSISYRNNITGRLQSEQPLDFRGGVIADEMGLGKTLSIIALIASDKEQHLPEASVKGMTVKEPSFEILSWNRNSISSIFASDIIGGAFLSV